VKFRLVETMDEVLQVALKPSESHESVAPGPGDPGTDTVPTLPH